MRHHTHHGFSFLLGVLLSTIISEVIRSYLPFLGVLITRLAEILKNWFAIGIDRGTLELVIITFFLGLLYGYMREVAERNQREGRR
jgi:hypothetical protein